MKTALIIYVIYESVFVKMASSSLDVTITQSMSECEQLKPLVVETIRFAESRIDTLIASCKTL